MIRFDGRDGTLRAMRRALEALVVAIALLALLVALHRDAVFHGKLLAPLDKLGEYEPWKSAFDAGRCVNPALSDQVTLLPWTPLAAQRLIHDGEMTLWNPFQGCGTPLHANTLSAQLFPLMWLHALLPRQAALLAIGLARGFLAGFFFFLLLRRRGVSFLASLFGALALPISGFYAIWLGHQQTIVACLLPLLLWLVDRAIERASPVRVALVGLVSGSTLLAGHTETALHVLLIAGAYAVFGCFFAAKPLRRRVLDLLAITGGFLIGALISMAQVLPFLEYSLNSAIIFLRHNPLYRFHNAWRDLRPDETTPAVLSIVAALAAIVLTGRAARSIRGGENGKSLAFTLLAIAASVIAFHHAFALGLLDQFELFLDPDRRGSPLQDRASGAYVGYLLYVEMNCGYASLAALPLAIAAMALRPRGNGRSDKGTLVLAAMVFISLAIVFEWPLVAHAISRTPVFAEAKNKRLLLASSFGILWLAAKGIDLLRDAARRDERRAFLAVLVAIAVLALGIVGGRFLAKPDSPVGNPSVPVTESTPAEIVKQNAAALARGELVAHVRDLVPERARAGDSIELSAYAFVPDSIASLDLLIAGVEKQVASRLEALPPPADLLTLERLPKLATSAYRAVIDGSKEAGLPTGRYSVFVIGKDREGNEVSRVACGALYFSRPATATWRYVLAISLLLLSVLFALGLGDLAIQLFAIAALLDLFLFADGFNPAVDKKWDFPTTPAIEFLKAHQDAAHPSRVYGINANILPANIATAYQLADTRNYDSVDINAYNSYLGLFAKTSLEGATRAPLDCASPLFDLLAARYVLCPKGTSDAGKPAPDFTRVFDREITIFENPHALPRCFVAQEAVTPAAIVKLSGGDPKNQAHLDLFAQAWKKALEQHQIFPGNRVLVLDEDAARFHAKSEIEGKLESTTVKPARFLVDDCDRLVVEAESDDDGVLFLADAFMPGWVASIDGQAAQPCARADLAFRAIPFPKGVHRVEFRYESKMIAWGMRLFGVGLGLVVALVAMGMLFTRSPHSNPEFESGSARPAQF